MSQDLLPDNTIRVTEYSLIDFTFAVAELGNKGFVPTLLNGSHPEGMSGSYYTCVMVPINSYRIGADGVEYNKPDEQNTTKSDSVKKEASDAAEATETAKTTPKTTRTTKK